MIWLVWRQHRKQALFAVAGLLALAAYIIPTGLGMRSTYTDLGLPACVSSMGDGQFIPSSFTNACNETIRSFIGRYTAVANVSVLLIFLPLLVGIFWGAPLVAREVEHGTHRLVWTQGVSRRQWAMAKFGLVGAGSLIVAVVYGFGVSWWMAPLNRVGVTRFETFKFDVGGIAPVGYTVFALALGIAAGTIFRKVMPAMAAVLVVFIPVRVLVAGLARPRFATPVELAIPVDQPNPNLNAARGDWIQSMAVKSADGQTLMDNASTACNPDAADCGGMSGALNTTLYQPGDRFWWFQGIETGLYVVVAAALIWIALRGLRRIA
ncbi:transporter [Nakamurella silvestris]|nr:transporter [Nakamurella silvestris]